MQHRAWVRIATSHILRLYNPQAPEILLRCTIYTGIEADRLATTQQLEREAEADRARAVAEAAEGARSVHLPLCVLADVLWGLIVVVLRFQACRTRV